MNQDQSRRAGSPAGNLAVAISEAFGSAASARKAGAWRLGNAWERHAKLLRAQMPSPQPLPRTAARIEYVPRQIPSLHGNVSDARIRTVARECAGLSEIAARQSNDPVEAFTRVLHVCRSIGIEPVTLAREDVDGCLYMPAVRRTCSSRWWRRRLRRFVARREEHGSIQVGRVSAKRQAYVSDAGLTRVRERRQRNSELMHLVTMVNECGDSFTLEELAAKSVSSPAVQRAELMVRIKGLEELAKDAGEPALFVTATLPSRFHATRSRNGRRNPAYDGTTPQEAARLINHRWALIRSHLQRRGIRCYGIRVMEPHHDSTPHAHFLIFAAVGAHETIRQAFKRYFLDNDCPDEPGAQRHRVTFKAIDYENGSAVAYIAKYVAKNIDGYQLDKTLYRDGDGNMRKAKGSPASAAERVKAWASIWGVRQFQFFGTPAVGLWREARRLTKACAVPAIEAVREPADRSDYAQHVAALGGVATARRDLKLKLYYVATGEITMYGEVAPPKIRGIEAVGDGGARSLTRLHTWTVQKMRQPDWRRSLDLCQ